MQRTSRIVIQDCINKRGQLSNLISKINSKIHNKRIHETGNEVKVIRNIDGIWEDYYFILNGVLFRWDNCNYYINKINGAVNAVNKIAGQIAKQVAKKLPQKALTKGIIYPIVKKVARLLGVQMTKEIFAGGVSKAIPVVGAVISGGLTFLTYKPMSEKLRKYLASCEVADVECYKRIAEQKETEEDSLEDQD